MKLLAPPTREIRHFCWHMSDAHFLRQLSGPLGATLTDDEWKTVAAFFKEGDS